VARHALSYRAIPASDHSLLISFGEEISFEHHQRVRALTQRLLKQPPDAIVNIHPAYSSVLVTFDPFRTTFQEIDSSVRNLLTEAMTEAIPPPRQIEIPVCYDEAFGPDLADVAATNRLTPEEVVRIHAEGNYYVAFIGFTPGFGYLVGMSPKIAAPRLSTPRTQVPAGSVAIGGAQTGIYPISTPGGWRIIGRTPLRLFAPERKSPSLLTFGDEVRFRRISRAEFDRLQPPT
jgi:inhibitor of KinA